jgi:hypothetical protein
MPALFAYLVVVALLLGGGYGALSWLAAPEPVKMAEKARPKSAPRGAAPVGTIPSEANSPVASDIDRAMSGSVASGSNESWPSPQPGSNAATPEQRAQMLAPEVSEPPQGHQNATAETQTLQTEVKQPAKTVPQDIAPASSNGRQTVVSPATVAKPVKRQHARQDVRQADGRSEKSGLAVMTLRTIEFPDGRRETRLIPYRSAPALAFDPLE